MKLKLWIILVVAVLLVPAFLIAANTQFKSTAQAATAFAKLPLSFEPAQAPGRFIARAGGYTVSLDATGAYLALTTGNATAPRMLQYSFAKANHSAIMQGMETLPGVVNYYRGKDPRNWRLGVPSYAKVRAREIYPGIDVVYYGDQRHLEFDLVVAPYADSSAIALNLAGADSFFLSVEGDLVADLGGRQFRFVKPYAYQNIAGAKVPVSVDYALDQRGTLA